MSTSSREQGLLVTDSFWTWREAIETASRLTPASGRITVTREGDRWVVRHRTRLYLMNTG